MTFGEFIQAVSGTLGLAVPVNAEIGPCSFDFADELQVTVSKPGPERILLSAVIGAAPENHVEAERHYKNLLQLNLGRLRVVRPSLAVNPHNGLLELQREIPRDLHGPDEAERELEDFLNELEFWKGQSAGGGVESAPMMMPFLR